MSLFCLGPERLLEFVHVHLLHLVERDKDLFLGDAHDIVCILEDECIADHFRICIFPFAQDFYAGCRAGSTSALVDSAVDSAWLGARRVVTFLGSALLRSGYLEYCECDGSGSGPARHPQEPAAAGPRAGGRGWVPRAGCEFFIGFCIHSQRVSRAVCFLFG